MVVMSVAHEGLCEGRGPNKSARKFGAKLPPLVDEQVESSKREDIISHGVSGSDEWDTTTRSTITLNLKEKKKARGGIQDPEVLEEYRRTWTTESPDFRSERFRTEAVISMNKGVKKAFLTRQTRKLPGTPVVVERLREAILAGNSLRVAALNRLFKKLDTSGDGMLQPAELRKGLEELKVDFDKTDFEKAAEYFDRNGDGNISRQEFLRAIRGELSETRVGVLVRVFETLANPDDGCIGIAECEAVDWTSHPAVINGEVTKEEISRAFLAQWEDADRDGKISFDEFVEEYANVSCSIEDDADFEAMVNAMVSF